MSENEKNMKDSMDERKKELDDFWDIGKLIPEKTRKAPAYPPRRSVCSTQPVDIEVPPPRKSSDAPAVHRSINASIPLTVTPPRGVDAQKESPHRAFSAQEEKRETVKSSPLTPRSTEPKDVSPVPLKEYTPAGVLLHSVKVYTWQSNYHYFDQFIKDAAKYAAMKGTEARREPFFSYFPQYAQMNRRQLAWYLWWREQVRADVFPDTDYAYVLLYMFELINLPATHEQAEIARDRMAKVWMIYRKPYPQLDHYMCEWLCDYCLIHELTAPVVILMPALGQIIASARLKEFYLSAMIAVGDDQVNLTSARILLSHCCHYDYRKSKFANGEHKELFDTLIPGAIAATFPLLTGKGGQRSDGTLVAMHDSQVSRDAYVGALCAYGNKRRIELSYTSFSRSHDLRFLLGDMVRHAENRLRGSIGVRSKLTTHFLTTPLKQALDAWLEPRLPKYETMSVRVKKEEPRPAYEAFYDLPHTEVSIASANEIEQSSWETTRILTEAFETAEETLGATQPVQNFHEPIAEPTEPTPEPARDAAPEDNELLSALGDRVEFLRLALSGDGAGQRAYCTQRHKLPDALADEINDLAVEYVIYDMILEESGGVYSVVEDYRDMICEMLKGVDRYE